MATILPFPQRGEYEGPTGRRFPGLYAYDLGLSDDQISALMSRDAQRYKEIFEVDPKLNDTDRHTIPILHRAVALLGAVAEGEPCKSTAGGNLPQKLVRQLFAGDFHDAEPDFVRVNREDDSQVLSRTRQLCQKSGMLVHRSGAFRLSKAARQALESADWSFIYRKLLETQLARPQLVDQYDRYDDGGALAAAFPILLFASRGGNQTLFYEEEFAWLIEALDLTPVTHWFDESRVVRLRFFERFGEPFGLFEPGHEFVPPWETREHLFPQFGRARRRTELFDRVLRWHVDPPARPAITDQAAASRIMSAAYEGADGRIDGSEDSWIEAICHRAIERCPDQADAYVVLARLYEHKPERALRFVELGLEATADQEPEVPDGLSAWDDRPFRDVIRLHLTRAEMLQALGDVESALEQFARLLEIDPDDGICSRDYYVAALLEAGLYDRAKEINESADDGMPFAAPYWNEVVIAFAQQDRTRAKALLADALEYNPYVPEMLLSRWPPDPPPRYSPGDENEAIIYASIARKAWRAVPGAIAWLRKAGS